MTQSHKKPRDRICFQKKCGEIDSGGTKGVRAGARHPP